MTQEGSVCFVAVTVELTAPPLLDGGFQVGRGRTTRDHSSLAHQAPQVLVSKRLLLVCWKASEKLGSSYDLEVEMAN